MQTDTTVTESWPLPGLLRAARNVYATRLRRSLSDAGCEDLPLSGSFVIGAIAHAGAPLAAIIDQLGVSKQTAGQLVDTLVNRGYLERATDPNDRRRLILTLTERGEAAAREIRGTVREIEAELSVRIGPEQVAALRANLAELAALERLNGC